VSEWWTYTLSDFLLFAPRTYYRLFELYNRELWPAQLLALGAGGALLLLVRREGAVAGRLAAAILAACWLWVAWGFHLERYATINWAAAYFAAAFALQSALLAWTGVVRGRLAFGPVPRTVRHAGIGLVLFALVVQPLAGRDWSQVELFGMAPDPTAVATLGVLLLASDRVRWALLIVPVLWCVVTGATLLAMDAPHAAIAPLAALLVLALAARRQRP
jgi:hypothetical protein